MNNESLRDVAIGVSINGYFSEHYSEISRWAMEITSHDRSVSEDLIHDAYIKLLRRREFRMADPNAYVYVSMRNTFRSQVRRRQRLLGGLSQGTEEILDQTTTGDPSRELSVSDSLTEICDIACARRQSTISASLLILRYFLGYSIDDLSKITNRSRSAVETRLSIFRRDLIDAESLTMPLGTQHRRSMAWSDDLTFERLRKRIFRSAIGRCISEREMRQVYKWKSGRPDRIDLGHLVSCRKCLDAANQLLKIDRLEQRHPADIFSKEQILASVFLGTFSLLSQIYTGLLAVA